MIHTDNRLAVVNVQCTFPISDQKREVEHVLDGLSEVLRVDDEFEEVDAAKILEKVFKLVIRMPVRRYSKSNSTYFLLTAVTFLVVSCSDRWMSSSVILCGFF